MLHDRAIYGNEYNYVFSFFFFFFFFFVIHLYISSLISSCLIQEKYTFTVTVSILI